MMYIALVIQLCWSGYVDAKVYSRCDVLRELRSVLQFVVLDTEFLVCLSPAHHVKVAVGALLIAGFLFGGLHAWGSGDP